MCSYLDYFIFTFSLTHSRTRVSTDYAFSIPQENSDIESLPEEARQLLQEKDTLINALQVCVGGMV